LPGTFSALLAAFLEELSALLEPLLALLRTFSASTKRSATAATTCRVASSSKPK
jgi:hypothetical protein